MSVAFTKDSDAEAVAANLPDRPIPTHANLVTQAGLAQIETALSAARAAYDAARSSDAITTDRSAMAAATRDLRYWSARRASARLVTARPADGSVGFGTTITLEREDGRQQTWRIVGDDEADPAAKNATASISYVSPLARAAMGKAVGDTLVIAGQLAEITRID